MKLDDFLKERGLTSAAFAETVSAASKQTIHNYRHGTRFPSPSMLRRITRATDGAVTAEDFVDQHTAAAPNLPLNKPLPDVHPRDAGETSLKPEIPDVGPAYPSGLADCMARAGLNDPQLAKAVGSTRQQIFKLRRGERNLSIQWAKRLAPQLNCTWQELVEGLRPDQVQHEHMSPERELLDAFWSTDAQGRAMILRLAKSLRGDARREAAE